MILLHIAPLWARRTCIVHRPRGRGGGVFLSFFLSFSLLISFFFSKKKEDLFIYEVFF